jgi:signal transduction histidine kinase
MHVEVSLRHQEDEHVAAEVEDDGRGFDRKSVRAGVGLSAMRERAASLGGKIEIASRPGEGARVAVRVPLGDGTPTHPRL